MKNQLGVDVLYRTQCGDMYYRRYKTIGKALASADRMVRDRPVKLIDYASMQIAAFINGKFQL